MSNKLNNLKWKSVALDGFPITASENFQGFVALEECKSYGLDKQTKKNKKRKQNKRKNEPSVNAIEVPNKKVRLSNGFLVESFDSAKPSSENSIIYSYNKIKSNELEDTSSNKKMLHSVRLQNDKPGKNEVQKKLHKKAKKSIPKLGENIAEVIHNLTPEDMLTWAEFKLPDDIVKALAELGYKKPTKIQQLTLPAAIHGRRDILGAAETGSGKTLAFGLPILSGIIKLKEKAALKGLHVQDIPYKKISNKKKDKALEIKVNVNKNRNKNNKYNKKQNNKGPIKKSNGNKINKESSEDGYGSGDDESDDEEEPEIISDKAKSRYDKEDNYLEEIEVPIRKRDNSVDEGNNSDSDDDNYVHLSDMLDSDDDVDTSDDENDNKSNNDEKNEDSEESVVQNNDTNGEVDDDDTDDANNESGEENDDTDEATDSQEEVEDNESGIGCVKVIDDIELPEPAVPKSDKPLYALILTPTRELAIQISRHLIAVAKYTGIRIATVVGGMARQKQERVLDKGPEIVVATPGRLWELLPHPHIAQAKHVKFLAIDETDRMIERGHFEELTLLLESINSDEEKRSTRQNFVFSATLTMVHDLPAHMKGKKVTKRGKILNRKVEKMTPEQKIKRLTTIIGMTDPKVVDITSQNLGTAESLTECRIACAFDHKDAYLYYLLRRHPGRTIVFCNSIGCVRRLAQLLTILECHPLPLHASMQQRQRLKNLEKFSHDQTGVLVATDVAARGLDIPDVQHVIHYQVPRTAENYVHRSGRTARAHKEGLTILMMEPAEAYKYMKLCRTLNKTSELPTFPVPPQYLEPMKATVSLAREVDALELRRRRAAQAQGWRDRVANEMDMIVDDDDVPVKTVDPGIERALQMKKKQLKAMLSRPIFPKGFSFKYPTMNDPDALKHTDENALQVMKKALESGTLKKEKRKGKNESLLKLEKAFKQK